MERDFFGVIGKETPPRPPAAMMVGNDSGAVRKSATASQWPLSSKISSLPSYMSFKTVPTEANHFFMSGLRPSSDTIAADINRNPSPVLMTQVSNAVKGCAAHGQQMKSNDRFGAAKEQTDESSMNLIAPRKPAQFPPGYASLGGRNYPSHQAVNMVPLLKQPYVGARTNNCTVGSHGHRFVTNAAGKSAQLTIFYAGSVNVFDNVASDKAQQIIYLANEASQNALSQTQKSDARVLFAAREVVELEPDVVITKQPALSKSEIALPASATSSPVSVASQNGTLSGSASSFSNPEAFAANTASPTVLSNSQRQPASNPSVLIQSAVTKPSFSDDEASTAVIPGAIPQARKASLARFLEKRRERVAAAAPYANLIQSKDNVDTLIDFSTWTKDGNLQSSGFL